MNKLNSHQAWLSVGLAGVLTLGQGGCSMMFSHPPPTQSFTFEEPPRCSRSVFPPIVDTIGAVYGVSAGLLFGLLGLTNYEDDQKGTSWNPQTDHSTSSTAFTLSVGSLVVAGVLTASALRGYDNASACRKLRRDYEDEFGVPVDVPAFDRWRPPGMYPMPER